MFLTKKFENNMPQLISKFKIFLASPSDLWEERESLDDVIKELNNNYGRQNNIIIELLKWETNSAPGIATDSIQSLINNDIPDYDLFIGLLWIRFGTPTKHFGSGTEEEFNLAYEKFKKNSSSVQILIYFKIGSPPLLDEIIPEELIKVIAFKKDLGEKNILYWDFNNKGELERFLRTHIPARIETLKKESLLKFGNKTENVDEIDDSVKINEEIEELGLIDYQEQSEEYFEISNKALGRISDATKWIGNEISKKAEEIEKLVIKNKNKPLSYQVQRNIFGRTANIMNEFSTMITADIPIFVNNFEAGIDAFSELVNIYRQDFNGIYEDEIKNAIVSIENLIDQIQHGANGMKSFLSSVAHLPRMSKELNGAKRKMVQKLTELISELEISQTIAIEVKKNMSV